MPSFRFRLARALDWYRKQSDLEDNRLKACFQAAAQARIDLEHHQREVLARHSELIRAKTIQAQELAALGSFRRRSQQQEALLRRTWQKSEQDLTRQRGIALAAQRRLRLLEKLRDRRQAEHKYETDKAVEDAASESHLAALVRGINQKPQSD